MSPRHVPGWTISKSDFKLALDCLLKLKHKRDGLGNALEDDDMLRLLSEGGGALEALAEAVEPSDFTGPDGGAEVAPQCLDAFRAEYAKAAPHGTGDPRRLREVTIVAGPFLGRLDRLRVWKDRIELVEQKSKSIGASATGGEDDLYVKGRSKIAAQWTQHMQDIGFQTELLRRWLAANVGALGIPANIQVVPKLLLVNKEGRSTAQDELRNFKSTYRVNGRSVRAEVRYDGAGPVSTALLAEVDVSHGFALMAKDAQADDAAFAGAGIGTCMDCLAALVEAGQWPAPSQSIGHRCKGCEYRVAGDGDCGFVRCWGKDPTATDHVLRLTRVNQSQFTEASKGVHPADASLKSLPRTSLTASQVRQWEVARSGKPWKSDSLAKDPLGAMGAPPKGAVAFLDFETVAYQIPARVGGAAYEKVPFQFEAVLLPSASAPLRDRIGLEGFLDIASTDPRRDFVRALQAQLSSVATIYHWSPYERTVLNAVRGSLAADPQPHADDPELVAFIDSLLAKLQDLLPVTKNHFLHPDTGGSYSIKRILPVVWSDPAIRQEFAAGAAPKDPIAYGDAADPYKSLVGLGKPFLEAIGGSAVIARHEERNESKGIQGGGTASLYYHWVRLFGHNGDANVARVFRDYCRLDARAMLMVYRELRGK